MIPEYELVLELCKFLEPNKKKIENLMESGIDYPLVLGHLLCNRMGAVAYYTLKECELLGKVNREFRNTLKSIYDADNEKVESFNEALKMICCILEKADFPYALLKGAYLSAIYPKGLRTSNDIDILIEPENITLLYKLLESNGFKQGHIRNGEFIPASQTKVLNSRINRGETVTFVKRVNLPKMEFCELDINFSVDFKAKQETNVVSMLLENRQQLINNTIQTLNPVDFLIHLCVHLFKEATVMAWVEMGGDLSLYKFCDIHLLTNNENNDEYFAELEKRINELGLAKECYYAFAYTQKLFNIRSERFFKLIMSIMPENVKYLHEIIDPTQNKTFRYNDDFIDFIFYKNRKECLYEITDATS